MKTITTQQELDNAGSDWVRVESGSFVARGQSHVEAREQSHVVARGQSHVEASEQSHVVAWEQSHVVAWEQSHVEAWDQSHVVARGQSHIVARGQSHVVAWDQSHVVARGQSHIVARGQSHVVAWGQSHVVARGQPHVEAWDQSHVEARDQSHVVARGQSHVVAWEQSHVEAWDFSSIVKLSLTTKIICGCKATLIIPEYPSDIEEWCAIKNIKIKHGRIRLFKCVQPDGTDFRTGTINYLQENKEIIAPDWDGNFTEECGHGLHLADSLEGAQCFVSAQKEYLLLEVSADINDCKPFGGSPEYPMKLRARACRFVKILEKHVMGN